MLVPSHCPQLSCASTPVVSTDCHHMIVALLRSCVYRLPRLMLIIRHHATRGNSLGIHHTLKSPRESLASVRLHTHILCRVRFPADIDGPAFYAWNIVSTCPRWNVEGSRWIGASALCSASSYPLCFGPNINKSVVFIATGWVFRVHCYPPAYCACPSWSCRFSDIKWHACSFQNIPFMRITMQHAHWYPGCIINGYADVILFFTF